MTDSAKNPSEARVHVLGAMLGVAIAFAAEKTVKGELDWPQIIAFPAFVITAVVFTIAMMRMQQDEKYAKALSENLLRASYDLVSDVLTATLLVVMAFYLDNAIGLFLTNLGMRFVDLSVIFLVVRPVEKKPMQKPKPR
ncbi:MAG: hypothetical protein ACLQME_12770 [Alphaproteobacteria bacterium]